MEFLINLLHDNIIDITAWEDMPNKWDILWKIYYDFYALDNPHIETILYRKHTEHEPADLAILLSLPHSMDVFILREEFENTKYEATIPQFREEPTTENFLGLLHTQPLDDVYKEVIIYATNKNVKFIKTDYRGVVIKKKYTKKTPIYEVEIKEAKWLKPVYNQTHILLALWKYVNL